MSAWPCHVDAASGGLTSVCHPGADRRAPSGGGSDNCSAGREEAEEKVQVRNKYLLQSSLKHSVLSSFKLFN